MDPRLTCIFTRRSVRRYLRKPVSEEDIRGLLEAAMAAPSANNSRPWHFVAVTDERTLKALSDVHPHGKMLAGAPLGVVVCADPALSDWWEHDCSAANENLLIAAAALGLGAVWLGVHLIEDREQAVRDVLGIPDTLSVLSIVSLGHPDEEKDPRTQYDENRIHRDRW